MDWNSYVSGLSAPKAPSITSMSAGYKAPSLQPLGGAYGTRFSSLALGYGVPKKATTTASKDKGVLSDVMPYQFEVGMPFSTQNPDQEKATVPIPANTKGDWLGSIDAAIRSGTGRPDFGTLWTGGSQMNLANMIPWFMERFPATVNAAVEQLVAPKTPGGIDLNPMDWMMEGVKALSGAIAPVFDALPNWYRDSELGDRAKVYKAIVSNQDIGMLDRYLMSGNLFGGQSARYIAQQWDTYRSALLKAADPHEQLTEQQKIQLLAESIDLPQSVKDAISANPKISDDEINKLLDKAGRAFSYQPGLGGVVQNVLPLAVIYGAEAIGTGGAMGAAKVGALGATAASVASKASLMGKLMTSATALGLGTTAIVTAGDAVARVMGNQAAQNFYEQTFKIHPMSDIPSVQVTTSFAVNPVAALRDLRAGIIKPVYGGADIVVGKATGKSLAQFFATPNPTIGILSRAFKMSPEWVKANLIGPDKIYPTMGDAYNAVLNWAAEEVLSKMSPEEQAMYGAANAGNWEAMHRTVLERFGREIAAMMKNEPDRIAKAIYDAGWTHHSYRGPFDPEIAVMNVAAYHRGQAAWEAVRHKYDAVVGYKELVTPADRAAIREQLDAQFPNPTDAVPDRFLNETLVSHPGLRYLWQDLGVKGQPLTRADMDEILARSSRQWDEAMGRDPRGTLTGRQTILEPGYTARDLAEALGTDEGTVKDVQAMEDSSRVRAFLASKTGMTPEAAAALTPDEAVQRAYEYMDTTARPWEEIGKQVASARKRLPELQRQMALADQMANVEAKARLLREYEDTLRMLHDAGDPLTPYSQSMRYAAKRVKAGRWVDQIEARAQAIATLNKVSAIDEQVAAMNGISNGYLLDMIRPTRNGGYGWAGTTAPISDALFRRLERFYRESGQVGIANHLVEEGDAQLWDRIRTVKDTPQFRRGMNRVTREYVERNLPSGHAMNVDEYADAWARKIGADRVLGEDFIAELARLKASRSEILAGKRLYDVQRTAASDLPKGAEAMTTFNVDPEWELTQHPANIEELRNILDNAQPVEGAAGSAPTAGDANWLSRYEAFARSHMPDNATPDERAAVLNEARTAADQGAAAAPQAEVPFAPPAPDADAILNILDHDPLLRAQASDIARQNGLSLEQLVEQQPTALRAIVPEVSQPVVTALDEAIKAGDPVLMKDMIDQVGGLTSLRNPKAPIQDVPIQTAEALAKQVTRRLSNQMRREILEAGGDLGDAPNAAILHAPQNRAARQVLSLLNRGVPDTDVATLDGLLALQHEIELGNAGQMGIGIEMQAAAQKLIKDLVHRAVVDAKASGPMRAYFNAGMHPALMAEEDLALAKKIIEDPDIELMWGPNGPEDLAYGLKRRPKPAIVLEFESVPGLAEEFMAGHFAPYRERLAFARVRQAYNYIFGPVSNATIRLETYTRFFERLARQGVDPAAAKAVWDAWYQYAKESHGMLGTDYALYARPNNIPNMMLNKVADDALAEYFTHGEGTLLEGTGRRTANRAAIAKHASVEMTNGSIDYARAFREASSLPLRALNDSSIPLAHALGAVYGKVTTNAFVTTMYYAFRFGLDIRFHAMAWVENHLLYGGKAALVPGSLDDQLLGWTRQHFATQAKMAAADASREGWLDTGYPIMRGRDAAMYRAYRKMQGGALTKGLKGIQAEDPALMDGALLELARTDPDLAQLIRANGDDPVTWLKALDKHYERMVLSTEPEEAISAAIWSNPDVIANPQLNELWSRLTEINTNLVRDLRETFFGNPDRSRLERTLNSYLLLWPLSYQIKATKKWMLPLMFDNVAGIRTGALGALSLDRLMAYHNERLKRDPDYANWMEQNREVLFLAQMLLPMTPVMGVAFSPFIQDALFGRTKNVLGVGPVYSYTSVFPNVIGELYQDIGSLPGMAPLLGYGNRVTGRTPKELTSPPASVLGRGD